MLVRLFPLSLFLLSLLSLLALGWAGLTVWAGVPLWSLHGLLVQVACYVSLACLMASLAMRWSPSPREVHSLYMRQNRPLPL
jgi:hypothetical protein